jgi:hypothetical protein
MPKAMYDTIDLPHFYMVPTKIRVQLTDSTIRHPEGIIRNIVVKVQGDYVIVVLDTMGDAEMPLILGRSFLLATQERIDVGNSTIRMKVGGRIEVFLFQSKKEFYYKAPSDQSQGVKRRRRRRRRRRNQGKPRS